MIALLLGLPTIAPPALQSLIERDAVRVYDVNGIASWRHAHIPSACWLDPQSYAADDLATPRETTLVFYCSGPLCRKAPIAARRALRLGYADVRVMSAGIRGWLASGLPVERGTA